MAEGATVLPQIPDSAAFVFGQTRTSDPGHVRLHFIEVLHSRFESREADFSIWLARRSSRFSFSRSLTPWASAVVVPGRSPASTWSWLTHDRSVSEFTPSWSPIRRKILRRALGSA